MQKLHFTVVNMARARARTQFRRDPTKVAAERNKKEQKTECIESD